MTERNIGRATWCESTTNKAKRGWHVESLPSHGNTTRRKHVIVRDGYHAVKCEGEAHSNPHIDNCMGCLNHTWGVLAVKDGES